MVSKNTDDSQRRVQFAQLSGNGFRFDEAATNHILNHEVSEKDDEIRLFGICCRHDFLKPGETPVRRTHVQVRQDGDLEPGMHGVPGLNWDGLSYHAQT
jgi:hypothetical protein